MKRYVFPIFLAATVGVVVSVNAGVLEPPPGPIMPTMKNLDTVQPRVPIGQDTTPGDADSVFKITQPGSYYLTGNITGVSGKMGIEIVASGVTLDLMGFDLVGVPGSMEGVNVTVFPVTTTDIKVVNGSVRNWLRGVDLNFAVNTILLDLRVSGNVSTGIHAGANAVVTRCVVYNNGFGILSNIGSTITDTLVLDNASDGINADAGTIITNCTAKGNGRGIVANTGSTITNCSATSNISDGIVVSSGCTVRGNTSDGNGAGGDGAGIHAVLSDNHIEGNNCTNNDRGIDVDFAGNFITRNTCSGNTINNWDVVAGNVCLVLSATTSAAILGNSGGVAPGSTDPNANFTY